MWTFFSCGVVLLIYAWIRFKKRVFYPSVIFCFMWGMNCIMHFLIYAGYVNPLTDISTFDYKYMDNYIIYFTIATIIGFSTAHRLHGNLGIHLNFDSNSIDKTLNNYKWIMWLNFFGGLLRIYAMVSWVGFSFSNIIDYRIAANSMMTSAHGGFVGWVFRLTAYINLFAILYVAMAGLNAGFKQLKMKDTIKLFILFTPVQMATGGRLFILYFLIFYFGCFILARGISMQKIKRDLIARKERSVIRNMMFIMMPLVVIISLSRGDGGVNAISKYEGSYFDSFSYISDGTMTTDKCMELYSGGESLTPAYGATTFWGSSEAKRNFNAYKHNTIYASSVGTIILSLFLDFGYMGSLIVWTLLAFFMETLAIKSLSKLTIIRFFIFVMLLKICYESVLANPFAGNIPFFELLILIVIFYKPIFGRFRSK